MMRIALTDHPPVATRLPRALLWLLAAALLILLQSCASSPPMVEAPDVDGTVDFATILRFSEAYHLMRHTEDPAAVTKALRAGYDDFVTVDLPAVHNRYMIGTRRAEKKQEIWIRGTANFTNALYDARIAQRMNKKLGIRLHEGFAELAFAVYHDILPRLHKDFDLVIYGHSLGAAEAVILAMLLDTDGYTVAQVYASGQPRVTDAVGAAKFDYLPILRIATPDDPVPFLPLRDTSRPAYSYVDIGSIVILYEGPYYSLLSEDRSEAAHVGSFWKLVSLEGPVLPVQNHLMPAYMERLRPKLVRAIQIPYAECEPYMIKRRK